MLIKKYKSQIVSIENKIQGVYTITLASQLSPFQYSPGQFLHLTIDSEYDGVGQWPESRCFSIQSAPNETFLKITFAVKGTYTHLMATTLKQNSIVWLKLPYGNLFNQEHSKENVIFISGGTGITPFLSLFTSDFFTEYINPIFWCGFKSKGHNIYHEELKKAIELNPTFTINFVYEDLIGILNIDKINKSSSLNSSFFISGPPLMIKSFKDSLLKNKADIDKVFTDEWE